MSEREFMILPAQKTIGTPFELPEASAATVPPKNCRQIKNILPREFLFIATSILSKKLAWDPEEGGPVTVCSITRSEALVLAPDVSRLRLVTLWYGTPATR